ncbi:MAG: hypothetical protein ACPGR7_07855 [Flavobacteriaceae bacterium]
MKSNLIRSSFIIAFFMMGLSSVQSQNKDAEQKEKKIQNQREKFAQNKTNALNEMYKAYPESKAKMTKSYGYAAFANTGVNLLLVASGNGGGKAHNNTTGEEVYVKMISAGVGVGIGFKKYFAVFLFENKAAYDNFLDSGWGGDLQADATGDTGKEGEGGSVAVGMAVASGVTLYQVADKGLAVQATLQGTKFVVADELN